MRFDRSARIALMLLFALDIFVWYQVFGNAPASVEKLYFLDVGQGDSELLLFPGNVKVLTDAGPDGRAVKELEKILPVTDRYLDLVVLTHTQRDHFGGLRDILGAYGVGALVWNGKDADPADPSWEDIRRILEEKKIPTLAVRAGERIKAGRAELVLVSPDEGLLGSADPNDGALVMYARWPKWQAFLASDMGPAAEEFLAPGAEQVDVLKVAHHGSKYSSGERLLSVLRPRLAGVEVGSGNRYGHPTPEALARLKKYGARVFRTDQNGTVEVAWNEGKLSVFPEKP